MILYTAEALRPAMYGYGMTRYKQDHRLPPVDPPTPPKTKGLLYGDGRQSSPASGKSCVCAAALRASADCLETIGGRVFLMSQSPPDSGAGAVIASRENLSMYGGDKEHRMYQPASTEGGAGGGGTKEAVAAAWASAEFYRVLARDCATRQVRQALL